MILIQPLLTLVLALSAGSVAPAVPEPSQEIKLAKFQLVLFRKGPSAAVTDTPDGQNVVKEHLAYMMKLHRDGVSHIAGPVIDEGEIQGIMILNVPTPDKAREIESSDPAVKAGIFSIEVLSFFADPSFGAWREPLAQERVYFGFLNSGPNRGQDRATAERLQAEHLAYMDRQHKEGKLVLAGPLVDAGIHRGIVVYRVATAEEARRRAEGDPMIKVGRLAVDLHPWLVPKGALP
jgi:uncharacterized protein YciI